MIGFVTGFLPRLVLNIFFATGCFVSLRFVANLVFCIYNLTLRSGKSLKSYGAATDAGSSWAIVTGASDGIGKEFALQLAKGGFNIIIMARSLEKLEIVAEQIRAIERKVMIIPFDFSSAEPAKYEDLLDKVKDLEIRILVNNVGVSHDLPIPFTLETEQKMRNIINVNVTASVMITNSIISKMKGSNKKSLVLNVGSFAGLYPQPYLSVYSGSKAFLRTWSQALAHEMRKTCVDISCLSTYFVVSNMSKIRRPSFFAPTAHDYVSSVLARLGNPGGSREPYTSSPYLSHGLINWALDSFVPSHILLSMTERIMLATRERALHSSKKVYLI